MNFLKHSFSLAFLVAFSATTFAQDSLKNDGYIQRKNVIRYNLTPNILGFKSYIVGYERIVKPYQSFSVNVGYLALGKSEVTTKEEYNLSNSKEKGGFSLAADYRFYLQKENKFKAPHGIYFGPYLASYFLRSDHHVVIDDQSLGNPELDVEIKFAIQNMGVELGYQFLIKNRFTIDLILLGPSFSNYRLKMKATSNVTISDPDIQEALEALRDLLIEEYPWAKELFENGEIDVNGNKSSWGLGFRYVIQVGYNF